MQESMRVISGGNTGNAARLWHTPLRTRAAVRPALRQGAALAVGLAGGWAVLYGALLPFGLGLALGLGEDCFAASAAGAALGLLLHGFGALSLQSICLLCGLGAIVAGRWLWPGRFLPAAAAGGAALACSAFCLSLGAEGGGVELLLFCGADALLAGAIGFGLRRFPPEKPGAGTLLPAMACAAALGSLALGPLVLGVAACAAAEYLLCCQGKGRAALALCAATGAALCAVDPELAPAAAGLSCATGAAALLAPGRRVEALAAYAGGCVTGALCVQPPGNAFSALLSAGAGLGVVCFLPRQWLTPAGPEEPPGETPQEERPRLSVAGTRLRRSTRYTTRSPAAARTSAGSSTTPTTPYAPTAGGANPAGNRSMPPRWRGWRPSAPFWNSRAIWNQTTCPGSCPGASTRRRSAPRLPAPLRSTAAGKRPMSTPRPSARR